jgi:hypothetical protein
LAQRQGKHVDVFVRQFCHGIQKPPHPNKAACRQPYVQFAERYVHCNIYLYLF